MTESATPTAAGSRAAVAAAIHRLTCRSAELSTACDGATSRDFDLAEAALGAFGLGVLHISAERTRQVGSEGYTPEHDAEHVSGELPRAAACYALAADSAWASTRNLVWPRAWTFKRASRIRMLVKAGALIAAEIDRLLAQGEADA